MVGVLFLIVHNPLQLRYLLFGILVTNRVQTSNISLYTSAPLMNLYTHSPGSFLLCLRPSHAVVLFLSRALYQSSRFSSRQWWTAHNWPKLQYTWYANFRNRYKPIEDILPRIRPTSKLSWCHFHRLRSCSSWNSKRRKFVPFSEVCYWERRADRKAGLVPGTFANSEGTCNSRTPYRRPRIPQASAHTRNTRSGRSWPSNQASAKATTETIGPSTFTSTNQQILW